jgi:pimeloyl-ACP methyl ester carboxylesterase
MTSLPVFLIGGAGPPAPREFATLIDALGDARPIVPWDMVVFHGGPPAADYSLAIEVRALLAGLDEVGAPRAHLVGFSGGAAVALAIASDHPQRVASLALEEPAWIGTQGATPLELRFWDDLTAAMALEPYQALLGFRDLMVQPQVRPSLPPVPLEAPWIDSLVNGVRASIGAFAGAEVDWQALQQALFPIYAAVGSLTNPVFELRSRRIAERVPRTTVEVFGGLHHIAPPHRGAAESWAVTLEAMWSAVEVGR